MMSKSSPASSLNDSLGIQLPPYLSSSVCGHSSSRHSRLFKVMLSNVKNSRQAHPQTFEGHSSGNNLITNYRILDRHTRRADMPYRLVVGLLYVLRWRSQRILAPAVLRPIRIRISLKCDRDHIMLHFFLASARQGHASGSPSPLGSRSSIGRLEVLAVEQFFSARLRFTLGRSLDPFLDSSAAHSRQRLAMPLVPSHFQYKTLEEFFLKSGICAAGNVMAKRSPR